MRSSPTTQMSIPYHQLPVSLFFFSVVNRECMEECTIKGITIPAGMIVQADSKSVHYNPDIWGPEDTALFVPERLVLM